MKRLMTTLVLSTTLVLCQNWQPVYELFNPTIADHFYTMNTAEVAQAENSMGYTNHGPKYKWSSADFYGGTPIYRLWNESDHFYTTSIAEKDNCVAVGYTDEGIVGYLASAQSGELVAWYRYYHSNWDDHAYPTDQDDIDLLEYAGYLSEGVHGYVQPLSSGGGGGGGGGGDDPPVNQPPDAVWTCELYNEYYLGQLTVSWQGSDDQTDVGDLQYHVQLTGEGGTDQWTNNTSITFSLSLGWHQLIITAEDGNGELDPSPLQHEFNVITPVPDEPYNLAAEITDDNHVTLTWSCNNNNVSFFGVARDDVFIANNLPIDSYEYHDDDVIPGNTYNYVIVSVNDFMSSYSPSLAVVIPNGDTTAIYADWFDYPVGYPDFETGWYDAQPYGSVLAVPNQFHSGNDLNKYGGDLGEPIYASANGKVVYLAEDAPGWGKCLIIRHESSPGEYFYFPDGSASNLVYFMFAHLDEIGIVGPVDTMTVADIVVGETVVARGQQIATVGRASPNQPPHLHLECWSQMNNDYPLGYGYYDVLPPTKYDAMEFIANNRTDGMNFAVTCHSYNTAADGTYFSLSAGSWQAISGAVEQEFVPIGLNNYIFSSLTSADNYATWQFALPMNGMYELMVYVPNRHYTTVEARYVLHRDSYVNTEFIINGSLYDNEWVGLGNYYFYSDELNYMILCSQTNELSVQEVAADAIRLRYVGDFGGGLSTDESDDHSMAYSLNSYPNPFNGVANIKFTLSNQEFVNLSVYNLLGEQIAVLANEIMFEGEHSLKWNVNNDLGKQLASGTYFVVLRTKTDIQTMKVNYLR